MKATVTVWDLKPDWDLLKSQGYDGPTEGHVTHEMMPIDAQHAVRSDPERYTQFDPDATGPQVAQVPVERSPTPLEVDEANPVMIGNVGGQNAPVSRPAIGTVSDRRDDNVTTGVPTTDPTLRRGQTDPEPILSNPDGVAPAFNPSAPVKTEPTSDQNPDPKSDDLLSPKPSPKAK